MASAPLLHGKQKGKRWKQWRLSSSWAPKSLWTVTAARKSEDDCSWQESDHKPRQCVEKQRHYSANKGPYGQGYGLPSGHVQLWESDCKEGRMPKNWCLLTVVLEKTPESPSDSKEIKPVSPKGNQYWIFIERTEAEVPILWPPDVKSWLIKKDLNTGKDWRQEEKETTEDEMVGWHHWLNGHEFE